MLSRQALDFLLRVTDYFHGHWEDPEWGKRPASQILIAVAIADLATGLQDAELRTAIRGAADKVVGKNGQLAARG